MDLDNINAKIRRTTKVFDLTVSVEKYTLILEKEVVFSKNFLL